MITTIPRSRTLLTATLVLGALILATFGASSARADAVDDWYAKTDAAVQASLAAGVSAQASNSRIWAYSWTAANRAVRGSHHSRLRGDAAQAAVAQSVHDVLVALTPQIQASLDQQLTDSLAAIPNGPAKAGGVNRGAAAAAAVLAERSGDGLDFASVNLPFTPGPAVTGAWQFVPPLTRGPVQAGLKNAKTFILDRADRFRPGPAPGPGSAIYRKDFNESKSYGALNGSLRTPQQTDLAKWIAQTSVNQYTQVLKAVLAAKASRSVAWRTRLLAVFHQVTTDAQIAAFEAKYHYLKWRPYTEIRNGDTDGDPQTVGDPAYETLLAAPQHPEYPSGHLTYAGAAEVVLTRFVGRDAPASFSAVSQTAPGVTQTYGDDAWRQLVIDNDNGRVWSGIHFRNSDKVGADLGRQVAAYDLARLHRR